MERPDIVPDFRVLVGARPLVGTWVTFADPMVAEVVAGSGVDFLAIDLWAPPGVWVCHLIDEKATVAARSSCWQSIRWTMNACSSSTGSSSSGR